ncbi:MAG: tRNA (N6-isopentenyl adenosine(37)-C2)-methylthiotransferase MiaB [Thermodesulfobacteriota bacterium]|nr:tRNA (N6-isopentenyl adenosine(37)-C2)-methylthiotransferase MiaB [Thermodesulfobacteriota bacterium]
MSDKNNLKVFVQTFGCQMNENDSDKILYIMEKEGFSPTNDETRADLIIINTCSVRKKPEHKAYSSIGRFKRLKEMNPELIIGAGGCLAQQEGRKFLLKIPYVDFVFGTHNIHKLPELIKASKEKERKVETEFYKEIRSLDIPGYTEKRRVTNFVTIMQGCNNYCSYCIVPYVRGREESRSSRSIINEITGLAEKGVKEVTLLGQNVNSYGLNREGELTFPELLKKISLIEELKRIRFTTSHPKDMKDELILCFKEMEKLAEHIHLPIQSGSDNILLKMGRGYTKTDYFKKVELLRRARPGIAITTDFIVGFPGETDKDFMETLDLVKKVEFDEFFSFKYSDRPGTRASFMEDKIPEHVKSERLKILQDLQKNITMKKNRAFFGKVVEVLTEGKSKKNEKQLTGRTGLNKIVNFYGEESLTGKLVKVKIEKVYSHSLKGKIFSEN